MIINFTFHYLTELWPPLSQAAHLQLSIIHQLLTLSPTKSVRILLKNQLKEETKEDLQNLRACLNAQSVRRNFQANLPYRAISFRLTVKTSSSHTPVDNAARPSPTVLNFLSISAHIRLSVHSNALSAIKHTRPTPSCAITAAPTLEKNPLFVLNVARHLCRPSACAFT